MSDRLTKLVKRMCGQDSGLVIALYCPDAFLAAKALEGIAREIKPQQGVILTHNGDKILLLGYDHKQGIRQGWINGGQPSGVIFYDLMNVEPSDVIYAASRVHRPRGLFKDFKVVSMLAQGNGLQGVVGTFHLDYLILECA